jgi:CheY-like chemotaxis protein
MEQSEPKTLLIVEDDEAVRQGIVEVVEAWGWDVLEASNGIHGLAVFRDNLPDVVLTDVLMSGLDGFQLTAEIKSIRPEVPVIIMTALSIPRLREKVRSVGASEVLSKPFEPEELFNALRRAMRSKERRMVEQLLAQLYEQIRQQAKELQDKNAELERLHDVNSALLAFISRGALTPLTLSMGYSGMLLDGMLGALSEDQSRAVRAVLGQSADLLTLIDNVLEATRLETGRAVIEAHEVDLRKIMEEIRAGYSAPPHKDITLEWRLPAELFTIKTDAGKLK